MSFYRPNYNSGLQYDDIPPPPPLPDSPPPPLSPHNQTSNGHGMLDSWRPSAPPSRDFTFRNPPTGPAYPQEHARNDGQRRRLPDHRRGQPNRANDRRNLNAARRDRPQFGRGGKRIPIKASSRPLLQERHRDDTEMEMLGVDESAAKYLEEIEDSDVDSSASDHTIHSQKDLGEGFDGAADDEAMQPPLKRRNVNQNDEDGSEKPKWCNPDPYHEHAPNIDESTTKRKDPVETIRKYRKIDGEKPKSSNQVADNDDFISFDFGGGSVAESEDELEKSIPPAVIDSKMSNGYHGPLGPYTNATSTAADLDLTKDHNFAARTWSQIPQGEIVLDTKPGSFRYESDRYGEYGGAGRSRKRDYQGRTISQTSASPSFNGLIEEWWPERDTNPIPWLSVPKYIIATPGLRLHMEICDFFEFVKPQSFEKAVRDDLIGRVQEMVKNFLPQCTVRCFGSFASGLYLPNADMDLVVMSQSYMNNGPPMVCQSHTKLFKFSDMVRQYGIAKDNDLTVVAHAKVPLIKFVDRKTNIKVDISFENNSGIVALDTFDDWKTKYPAMPIIVTLIKQFLLMRAQNEVQFGGIGGFTVTCLVTSLLQNMPRVQTGELIPEDHLGEILIEFLDFYGNRFDVSRTGITMETPGYFDKKAYNRNILQARSGLKPSQPDRIAILDPNKANNDISGGSKNVMSIFRQFADAHREILIAMRTKASKRPSLLDWMIGGNYTDVMRQRNLLRDLYYSRDDRVSHRLQNSVISASNTLPAKPVGQPRSPKTQPPEQMKHHQRARLRKPRQEQASSMRNASRENQGKIRQSKKSQVGPPSGDRSRANVLRQRFPHRSDIPAEVTKEQAKTLISERELNAERAQQLRQEYPTVPGIPNEISKAERTKLIRKIPNHKKSHTQSNSMVLTKSKGLSAAPARGDAASRASSTASVPKAQAPVPQVITNPGPNWMAVGSKFGNSNSNPIELD